MDRTGVCVCMGRLVCGRKGDKGKLPLVGNPVACLSGQQADGDAALTRVLIV